MNTIREIERLNKRELENCVYAPSFPLTPKTQKPTNTFSSPPEASWHTDYRDTAYVHIGGLPFTLTEGDILTIFSQYGEPTYLHLVRDKETGKSRGFGWLKYEDQRSCDLAVDNLGGATVLGRTIRVDHARYKRKDGEDEEEERKRELREEENGVEESEGEEEVKERQLLPEELELLRLEREHDEDDPMKEFLVQEKREEVAKAVKRFEKAKRKERKEAGHRHHHHRHHRRRSKERRSDEEGSGHRRRRSRDERREASDEDMKRRERRHHQRRSRSP